MRSKMRVSSSPAWGQRLARRAWVVGAAIAIASSAAAVLATGCGGSEPKAASAPGGSQDQSQWPASDRSLCQTFFPWKENALFEVSETAGPGSLRPNVRRVFKTMGDRDNRHTVLLCREIDTNLDGIKDLVRTFNDKGEPLHEEADTNYDGKIDVWINFADGRIEEEDSDATFSAGRPNVWKFYVNGQLSRIRRNTRCANGKADTWEIYYNDRLERVGTDNTCDGHVDRWDRDSQLMAAEEAAQDKAAQAAAAADAGLSGTAPVTVEPNGAIVSDGGVATNARADGGRRR